LNVVQIVHILFHLQKNIPKVIAIIEIGCFEPKKANASCNNPIAQVAPQLLIQASNQEKKNLFAHNFYNQAS